VRVEGAPVPIRRLLPPLHPGDGAADGAAVSGHIVTRPSVSQHLTMRSMTDVELLLIETIVATKAGTRSILDNPPPLDECAWCEAAYASARMVIQEAGGVRAWMRSL
jgi:hypothetical protein